MGKKRRFLLKFVLALFGAALFLQSCGEVEETVVVNAISFANEAPSDIFAPTAQYGEQQKETKTLDVDEDFDKLEHDIVDLIEKSENITNEVVFTNFYKVEPHTPYYFKVAFTKPENFVIESFIFGERLITSYDFVEVKNDYVTFIHHFVDPGYQSLQVYDLYYYNDSGLLRRGDTTKHKSLNIALPIDTVYSVEIFDLHVERDFFHLNFYVEFIDGDYDNFTNNFYFALSDGQNIIQTTHVHNGYNDIFNDVGLEGEKQYEYALYFVTNVYDGRAATILTAKTGRFRTIGNAGFDYVNYGFDYVVYGTRTYGSSSAIDIINVELYDGNSRKLLQTSFYNEDVFENLYSNYRYYLVINYLEKVGETQVTKQQIYSFLTFTKATPEFNVDIHPYFNELYVSTYLHDYDYTVENISAKLYQGDILIETFPTLSEWYFSIPDLRFDTEYLLEFNITYDLNDAKGLQTLTRRETVRTEAKDVPEIVAELYFATTESLHIDLYYYDMFDDGAITEVTLLKDEEVIEKHVISPSNPLHNYYEFTDLLSDNKYVLAVKHVYNLDDGKGTIHASETFTFSTLAKETPFVEFIAVIPLLESVSFDLDIWDYDYTGHVKLVNLYLGDTLVDTHVFVIGEEWADAIVFTDLYTDSAYTLEVEYVYDLNDGVGVQTLFFTHEFNTLKMPPPSVKFSTITMESTSFTFNLDISGEDETLMLDTIKLYEGATLLETLPGATSSTFTNLLSDTKYTVEVYYSFDENNGRGRTHMMISTDNYSDFVNSVESSNVLIDRGLVVGFSAENTETSLVINNPIADYAFRDYNYYVREIHLGPNVTSIGADAFSGLANLRRVYFYSNTIGALSTQSFAANFYNSTFQIYVPPVTLESYRALNLHGLDEKEVNFRIRAHNIPGYRDVITLATIVPSVAITIVDTQDTSIAFKLTYIDPEDVMTLFSVSVFDYNNFNVSLNLLNENEVYTTTGLNKNTFYTISVEFTYHLNDDITYHNAVTLVVKTNYFAGKGTSNDPYLIKTTTDMENIEYVPGPIYFALANDLDYTGKAFTPLDTFEGYLDGKGYAIRNLTLLDNTLNNPSFINENRGTIRNLVFTNTQIISYNTHNITFGIVTSINYGQIENVTVDAEVTIYSGRSITFGAITSKHEAGRISDVKLNLVINEINGSSVTFGGVAAVSKSEINNVKVKINGFFAATNDLYYGSVSGLAYDTHAHNIDATTNVTLASDNTYAGGVFGAISGSTQVRYALIYMKTQCYNAKITVAGGLIGKVFEQDTYLNIENVVLFLDMHFVNEHNFGYVLGDLNDAEISLYEVLIVRPIVETEPGLALELTDNALPFSIVTDISIFDRVFFYNTMMFDPRVWELDSVNYTTEWPYIK